LTSRLPTAPTHTAIGYGRGLEGIWEGWGRLEGWEE